MPMKPWLVRPKRSLGVFEGIDNLLKERKEQQILLEDRIAQQGHQKKEDELLDIRIAEARQPKAPTILTQKTDETTGDVYNIMSDGSAQRVRLPGGSPTPSIGGTRGGDDETHGGPQQAGAPPAPAPATLRLGVKQPAKPDPYGGRTREQWLKDEADRARLTRAPRDPKDPTAITLTEGERKGAAFAHRVIPAGQRVNKFDDAKTLDVIADKAGMLGNWARTDEGRQLRQAGLTWAYAVLRQESGAQISDKELDGYFETFLPRPGDDDNTLAMKRQARREAEEGVSAVAGRALPKGAFTSAIQADSAAAANKPTPAGVMPTLTPVTPKPPTARNPWRP